VLRATPWLEQACSWKKKPFYLPICASFTTTICCRARNVTDPARLANFSTKKYRRLLRLFASVARREIPRLAEKKT
jgi:hypothetical protein